MTNSTGENASSETWTELRMVVDGHSTGIKIRKGLIGQSLNAVSSHSVVFKYYAQALGNARITRDSPFLEGVDTKHLDSNGIVQPGTIVTENLIAVSAVSPIPPQKAAGEMSLLAAILGNEDEQQVRDNSSFFSAEHIGYVVTAVTRENIRDRPKKYSEPGLIDRVTISLERHDALAIGDFIEFAGCSSAVVEIIDDELMPTDENEEAVDAIVPLFDASFANGSAHRISVRRRLPSVRDTVEARSIGPYSLITLMPLKSRGFRGQSVTATAIRWLLQNEFVAIAAELVSLKSDDLFNRERLRELDDGRLPFPLTTEVGAPESLFVATEELRLLGLAVDCESRDRYIAWRIAPAARDWLMSAAPMAIKKPETINYRSYRPVKGGLFCEQAFGLETHARRQRAAHFELAASIVPIIFRIGKQPILCQILGLGSDVIESIVGWRSGINQQSEVVPIDDNDCIAKGAEAINKLLSECGKKLPFDLKCLIQHYVYVIPPDYRPIVLLDSGNFATSDLNDLYRRVINRSNRLKKLCELHAPQQIIDNEMHELQTSVDQLQANGWNSSPILGEGNRPFRSGLDLVLQRIFEDDSKRVDWSASARAIVDSHTPKGQCTLPQIIFDRLRCTSNEPVLLTTGNRFVACMPTRGNEFAIRLNNNSATMLNLRSGENCDVHRPVTSEAVAEASRMITMTEFRTVTALPAVDANFQLEMLLSRIISGEPFILDTPQLFLHGGAGSLRRLPDEQHPMPDDDIRIVKKPVVSPPSLSELREVAESTERVSSVLRFSVADEEPPANEGRIGGRPWLPASAEWPRTRGGQPVPFFAQLPISPTLNASLPFSVDTEMLLTLFWTDEWWEADATSAPCVLLHGMNELQLRELPQELQARPLFRIESQLKKHLPDWQDIHRVLRYHFDKVPDELLNALKIEMGIEHRQTLEESRIGGHAYWIQDSFDDFVAQIVEDEHCGFSFGDVGSLFIYGREPGNLSACVQSH